MRNLKRALSLALASIMLLGMMVTGAGAVSSSSFTDYDSIVNQEAVEVTSGLGIFDGYTDGSFGPENVVTRAEMAVIICKILNGSDVDPSNFTGISHFTDVPSWAEGYVNFCASMGIVVGVGGGKFNPNGTVTTVEATTMLLKALGYFQDDEDQLGLDWKTTVTGRATYLNLYGALTLGANEGLTRDNVAELVFQTIQAQRVAYDDNRHLYVNNRNRDEVVTNGTKDWTNTFGENTFDMWIVDGVVTANSYTLDSLSETVNNAPRTNVEFYDARTIAGYVNDYPAQTYQGNPVNNGYPFEYTTGLDMIGHAARVYYKIERNAPVVFAITDRATKVEYVTYNSNTTNLANAANEAGFRRNTILELGQDNWKVNYSWTDTVGSLDTNALTWDNGEVNLSGPSVNKTLLVISNSSDNKVDVVIVLDQYLDTVRRVTENTNGEKEYRLTTRDGDDQNIPHGEFAVGDYVVVTDVGNQGDMLNFEAPEKVTASISKITGVSDGNGTVKSITADGTEYVGSPVAHHEASKQVLDNTRSLDNTTNFEDIQTIGDTTLLLDFQGKCIGLAEEETITNYAYAAQFGVTHNNGALNLNTQYAITVKLHFIDGTSGVYRVNTSDGSNNTFKNLTTSEHGSELYARAVAKLLNDGYVDGNNTSAAYPYINTPNVTANNTSVYDPRDTYGTIGVVQNGGTKGQLTGITGENTTGLGIYKVSVRSDNSVVLTALSYDESASVNVNGTRIIPGHSTFVKANGQNATQIAHDNRNMYQTSKTVYFYIDGCETAKNSNSYIYNGSAGDLSVGTKTGVANAISITVGSNKDENDRNESIIQNFVTCVNHGTHANGERDTVEAVLIYGYDMGYNDTLYFYKEGSYHLTQQSTDRANARVSITYDLYNADGEAYEVTYDDGGKYYDVDVARQMVNDKNTGYYRIGGSDLEAKYIVDRRSDENQRKFNVLLTDAANAGGDASTGVVGSLDGAKNVYILNANAKHNEFEDNVFTEIDAVGGISASTLVVDTTGNGIDSVRTIADKCDAGNTVRISYTYKTTGDNSYKVKVIFVTDYNPKGANTNPGGQTPTFTRVTWDPTTGNIVVGYHLNDYPIDNDVIKNWVEQNFGQEVQMANAQLGYVIFKNSVVPMRITLEKYFKVTNGTTGKYDYFKATSTNIPVGSVDVAATTNYLVDVMAGSVVTASDSSTLGVNLSTLGKDVTIYPAATVTTVDAGITPKVGSVTLDAVTNKYVAKGATINATAAAPNTTITATFNGDATKTDKGPAPKDVTVPQDATSIAFTSATGYVLKAGAGIVAITYTDGVTSETGVLKGGEETIVGNGTTYAVTFANEDLYQLNADGDDLVQNKTLKSGTVSGANVTINDGNLLKVTVSTDTDLKGVKTAGTTKYVAATDTVARGTTSTTLKGNYFKNGSAWYTLGETGTKATYGALTLGTAGTVADTDLSGGWKVSLGTTGHTSGWTAGTIGTGEYVEAKASQAVTFTMTYDDTVVTIGTNTNAAPSVFTGSTGVSATTKITAGTNTGNITVASKSATIAVTIDASDATDDIVINGVTITLS